MSSSILTESILRKELAFLVSPRTIPPISVFGVYQFLQFSISDDPDGRQLGGVLAASFAGHSASCRFDPHDLARLSVEDFSESYLLPMAAVLTPDYDILAATIDAILIDTKTQIVAAVRAIMDQKKVA